MSATARSDPWLLSTVTRRQRARMAQPSKSKDRIRAPMPLMQLMQLMQVPKSLAKLVVPVVPVVPVVQVVPVVHGLGLQWTQPFLKKRQSGMHSLKCKRLKKQLNEHLLPKWLSVESKLCNSSPMLCNVHYKSLQFHTNPTAFLAFLVFSNIL